MPKGGKKGGGQPVPAGGGKPQGGKPAGGKGGGRKG